jgi:hypothetical protein
VVGAEARIRGEVKVRLRRWGWLWCCGTELGHLDHPRTNCNFVVARAGPVPSAFALGSERFWSSRVDRLRAHDEATSDERMRRKRGVWWRNRGVGVGEDLDKVVVML